MSDRNQFRIAGPGAGDDAQDTPFEHRQEWSILECAQTLYRNRTTLAWIACAGLAAALLLSLLQPKLYQSQASIEIQGVNDNFLNLREISPTVESGAAEAVLMQTQVEILQDPGLLEKVVKKLGLENRPDFIGAQNPLAAWKGAPSSTAAAVETLRKNLNIELVRGSRIIHVQYQASDPQTAAELANAVAQMFIDENIAARQLAARATHDSLVGALDEVRSRLGRPEKAARAPRAAAYGAASREAEDNRRFHDAMLERIKDARVAAVVPQSTIRMVSGAQPSDRPYKPNLPLNLAIGLLGGLIAGIALVTLREQNNARLHAPGDAALCLAVPELGAIPLVKPAGGVGRLLRGNVPLLQADGDPGGPLNGLSEPFRATLASILSAGSNADSPRMFVVTSPRAGEGKTTVVSHLGITLAEISKRVLLIDGDMRRPRLHKIFDQPNGWGLSDLLREKNAVEDLPLDALVRKTAIPHLYLLPSGASADNIFSLLCSGRLSRLMPRFRSEFDYVLVDAPPCLEFADARIMARYVEEIVLVVQADSTDRRIAQAAIQRLLLDRIAVAGVILNGWDPARSDRYGYYPRFGKDAA